MTRASTAAAEAAFREERSAVLATLIRQLGDFSLAEDALQDAFAAAIVAWERDGVPRRPGAWITTTARRRAIDRLRRDRVLADRIERLGQLAELETPQAGLDDEPAPSAIGDDRLRLIFTCCHPALAMPARIALTLRSLGGLTTGEIARAFLVEEAAMAQRIVRAKRKIATARIPYRIPGDEELPDRLAGVLAVVYLVFNEGWSASGGDRLVRGELCGEAIRLGRLLARLMPDDAEVAGLLALMLLHDSRRAARIDARGELVALDDQDRALWDRGRIREGTTLLDGALRRRRPGPYQLQAAIAACSWYGPGRRRRNAASSSVVPSPMRPRSHSARSWSSSETSSPPASTRASRRESCSSISASRPATSGSSGIRRASRRPRRIASAHSSPRTSRSP
ncbi:MAG: polymerase sigma-70 factor, subfamily, partial [Solirubrobacteraceae bacterium]|nr:polymerase sigma-70 factor, subfamily [Solirubrobacteraceae bacterium]